MGIARLHEILVETLVVHARKCDRMNLFQLEGNGDANDMKNCTSRDVSRIALITLARTCSMLSGVIGPYSTAKGLAIVRASCLLERLLDCKVHE